MNAPLKKATELKLPSHWQKLACQAVVAVADMAHKAMIKSRSWSVNSPIERVRLKGQLERAANELAKLRETNRLLSVRMKRVPSHKRPQYKPHERLAILEYRAANGLSLAETARLFHVSADTVGIWQREVESGSESSLFSLSEPVNKFPEFVVYIVQRFKAICPHLGRKKLVQFLARAALHVADTTAQRMLDADPVKSPVDPGTGDDGPDERVGEVKPERAIKASKPNHVWHVDLTTVSTNGTCNVGELKDKALQGGWPFEWHVAVVEDHFSRACIGFEIFFGEPESKQMTDMLDRAIVARGKAPKYIISDRGKQFDCENYKDWCKDPDRSKVRGRRKITPRFGKVHMHGSIAVVERLIRSMKDECTRRIIVSYNREAFSKELDLYFTWYNEFRPHEMLNGRTPMEAHNLIERPANQMPRIEPRKRFPASCRCAGTQTPIDGDRGRIAELELAFLEGRRHLPIVRLKKTG